ncbi:MAG: SPOR domain-containing protein [Gemmatimonadales bacterium]|nr:SPOR domain-containing protein [Gemmatimonadales bacterium]
MPIHRLLLLATVSLWGCRSQAPAVASSQNQDPQHLRWQLRARIAGAAIRLDAAGGVARLYRLPRLTEIQGAIRGRLPALERVVGIDVESEFLYVATVKKELLALDLGSGRVDTVATGIVQAALGPDGTLYAVDAQRRVISLSRRTRFAWPRPLDGLPRDMFGSTDQRLVGIIPQDPPRLLVAAADQPPTVRTIAAGGDVAATRWGDLVAIAQDSGVTLYDPLGRREPAFVPLSDAPRALAFSPSGHRIYVARRNTPGLAALDRYDPRELDGVALPAPAAALRLDPQGRWLLARPATGDSAWIVDLPIKQQTGAIATAWQPDLPAIAPDGMLIYRHRDAVVAMRPDSLREMGRVDGGAKDLWVLTSWLPRSRGGGGPARADAAEADTMGAEGPLYVQVSTSQNPDWSGRLAQDLTRAGLAARVLPPQQADDGYRVVLGPYATRAQAEAIGRRLGRPFWIYQPGQ